jgi:hypothetical protein
MIANFCYLEFLQQSIIKTDFDPSIISTKYIYEDRRDKSFKRSKLLEHKKTQAHPDET